jgi:hypothetical protein
MSDRKLTLIGLWMIVGSSAIYVLNWLLSNNQWGQPYIGYILMAGIIIGTLLFIIFRDRSSYKDWWW